MWAALASAFDADCFASVAARAASAESVAAFVSEPLAFISLVFAFVSDCLTDFRTSYDFVLAVCACDTYRDTICSLDLALEAEEVADDADKAADFAEDSTCSDASLIA